MLNSGNGIGINSQMQRGDYSDHLDPKTISSHSERADEKVEPFHEQNVPSDSSAEEQCCGQDLENFLIFFPKVCLHLFLRNNVKSKVTDQEVVIVNDTNETQ
jgi:hypothetical protein